MEKEPCEGCLVLPICLNKRSAYEILTQCSLFYKHMIKETGMFEAAVADDQDEDGVITRLYVSPAFDKTFMLKRHNNQGPGDGIQAFIYDISTQRAQLKFNRSWHDTAM